MNEIDEKYFLQTIELLRRTDDIGLELESILKKIWIENLNYLDGAKLISRFSFKFYDSESLISDLLRISDRLKSQDLTSDLNLEWFRFVGSLKNNSRPMCVALVEASISGDFEYIHKSQFSDLIKGVINGKQYNTEGMFEFTNVNNYPILCNGRGCRHSLMPVSSAIIPKAYKEKIIGNKFRY